MRRALIAVSGLCLVSACAHISNTVEDDRAPSSHKRAATADQPVAGLRPNSAPFFPLEEDLEPIPASFSSDKNLIGVHDNSTDGDDDGTHLSIDQVIASSNKTIDIEIYEFDDAVAWQELLDAQTKRRVQIRIIKDPAPVSSTCDWFNTDSNRNNNAGCKTQLDFIQKLKAGGAQIVPFVKNGPQSLCGQSSPATANCYEHGKIMIADQEVLDRRLALISTGNFNASNLCRRSEKPKTCNRDYTYITHDTDVINGLVKIFENDFKQQRYDLGALILNDPYSKKATVSPYSLPPLTALIDSATKEIVIENQYMKDTEINDALKNAADRGVKIQMVLASVSSYSLPKGSTLEKEEALMKFWDDNHIQTMYFDAQDEVADHEGYLHAKAMVVDDAVAWIGSVNGSVDAVSENREFGIVFHAPDQVDKLRTTILSDFSNPNSETGAQSLQGAKDKISKAQTQTPIQNPEKPDNGTTVKRSKKSKDKTKTEE